MAYNRSYTLSEIAHILDASERRPRPDKPAGTGNKGHSISVHTNERPDFFKRPDESTPPKTDSIFLISRNSLVEIVHEVLNGPAGQQKLAELNDPKKQSVEIRALILRQGDFDVFTVYRPREVGSQASFDWLSSTKGDGCIVEVFVLVIKVPGSSSEEIHIQTTHPKHYARTLGDEIVARRP